MNGSLNFRKTILVCQFVLFLFVSGGCVPVNQTGNEVLAETVVMPSLTASTVPILAEKATETVINSPTLTPEPTVVVEHDINPVDEELAEQIKIAMPSMWFYDHEQNKFVERSNEDFNFSLYKTSKLFITDGNGEEVGFALHFAKKSLDNKSTEYFSLTDKSVNIVIPLRLYSQMGEYSSKMITYDGEFYTQKCMYGFTEKYTEFKLDTVYPQDAVDMYATANIGNFKKGEELAEIAIVKALEIITNEGVDKLFDDLQKGVLVELNTAKGKWIINRDINYVWSDTRERSYEIVDGELFLFNGFTETTQTIPDSAEGCRPLAWDISMRSFLNGNFGENAAETYKLHTICFINTNTIQALVIADLRED